MWIEKILEQVDGRRRSEVEQNLDPEIPFQLPSDFVTIGKLFGHGEFSCASSLQVYDPFAKNFHKHILDRGESWIDFREGISELRFYPEENGIIPFGTLTDGNEFGWIPDGSPDEWKVVHFYYLTEENDPFFSGLTTGEFLYRLLLGMDGVGFHASFFIPADQRRMRFLSAEETGWQRKHSY